MTPASSIPPRTQGLLKKIGAEMFSITKRFSFSASHVLEGLAEGHPCARLHGHNYEVEVVAESMELDGFGFVVDYRSFDGLRNHIDDELDHRHLNDVLTGPPSAEALARELHRWCVSSLPESVASKVVAVRVSETPRTWAEYRP